MTDEIVKPKKGFQKKVITQEQPIVVDTIKSDIVKHEDIYPEVVGIPDPTVYYVIAKQIQNDIDKDIIDELVAHVEVIEHVKMKEKEKEKDQDVIDLLTNDLMHNHFFPIADHEARPMAERMVVERANTLLEFWWFLA